MVYTHALAFACGALLARLVGAGKLILFFALNRYNDKFFSLGRTAAAPRPRRPLTTSILASLPPLPIASNALSGNFYTRFLRFLSIFRDF